MVSEDFAFVRLAQVGTGSKRSVSRVCEPRRRVVRGTVAGPAVIERTDDYGVLEESAQFFVDAFWAGSTTADVKEQLNGGKISSRSRGEIVGKQMADLMGRYGKLMGKRRLSSSFFVARTDGRMQGCVGVEVAVVCERNGDYEIWGRQRGESLFSSTLSAMPASARNSLRKAPLANIAEVVFSEQTKLDGGRFSLHPVLSNLAVSPDARGLGLGQLLCRTCEEEVRSWDAGMFKDIWLVVEEKNAAAKQLYEQKLGYQALQVKDDIEATRVIADGANVEIVQVPSTHLLLTKGLDETD